MQQIYICSEEPLRVISPSKKLVPIRCTVSGVKRLVHHRITEWLGLEGIPKIIEFQHPRHRQGHQPPDLVLDQAAQCPIQPGIEHLQGKWDNIGKSQSHVFVQKTSIHAWQIRQVSWRFIFLKDSHSQWKIKEHCYKLFMVINLNNWSMPHDAKY